VWTEEDDEEVKYGKWNVYTYKTTRAENSKIRPGGRADIWPNWCDGVPRTLRRNLHSDAFFHGENYHKGRPYCESIQLDWNEPQPLSLLEKYYHLLPSNQRKNEWSGVYRIFLPNTVIDRIGGPDPTGTLYIGMAGGGKRKWSTLRNRVMTIAKKEHHAIDFREVFTKKYSHKFLAVEWAFTKGEKWGYRKPIAAAILAEKWLLWCYSDSFGESPPWNERG
jgi:hypothetical protein